MAGCDPYAIHVALADQIRDSIAADVNVYPYPHRSPSVPSVSVWPGSPYISDGSMGGNGVVIVNVDLVIEMSAIDDESEFRLLSELLSKGAAMPSSLTDAIHADRTLGGVVDDAVSMDAEWSANPQSMLRAIVPVQIAIRKVGASA